MPRKINPKNLQNSNFRLTLSLWYKFLAPQKNLIALSFATKFLANMASNIALPIIIGVIINHLASQPSPNTAFLQLHIIYLFGLLGISIILEYIWNRLCGTYFARARKNLEVDVFDSLLNKSYRFHAGSFGGATVSQFNRFTAAFQYFHDTVFRDLFSIAINFLASMIVTFWFSPIIGLVMVVWTLIYVSVIATISRLRYSKKRDGSKNHSKTTGYLADVLGNILTVKIFSRERYEIARFRKLAEGKQQSLNAAARYGAVTSSVISLFMAVLNMSVLILSVMSVLEGYMQLGTLVLIQAFTLRLSVQLWQLGTIIRDLDRSFAESAEMTDILTTQPTVKDPSRPKRITLSKGEIKLKDIVFEYPDEYSIPQFFNKLNISIRPGEKVGIVGPSGSGKTTVLKLILKLADPSSGAITIDGHDLTSMRHQDIRNAVSYVPQEPLLFHRSLLDNLRYSNPEATIEEIDNAAEKSRSKVFIDRLPKGYETMVGERGFRLSAGQRQRIAIARAMLKPAPILIMDEATSAIDSESEQLIQDALDELMQARTTIVVAHRFSTIRKMDRIIFMSYGKIVEEGTHDELLALGGNYAKLWAHQSGDIIPS